MAPRPTRPSATAEKLVEVMTLEVEPINVYSPDGKRKLDPSFRSICYLPNGKQMISGSNDKSVRRWDLEAGKEIEEARVVCEEEVWAVVVSRDGRWVVPGGGNLSSDVPGELKTCEVETGMVKTLQGHSRTVTCIEISMDNKLLASGSMDCTARIWDLNTGELVAGPFGCIDKSWVDAVRFSQDSKKLAVKSGNGTCLEVWDLRTQKLDVTAGKSSRGGFFPVAPVFWTKKDKTIVAAFTFTVEPPTTIYEFDSSTLETVGAPFEAHTQHVLGLALSFDCALVASASRDRTIKLWAFESRQLLASFDQLQESVTFPRIILSPDSRQLAYATSEQNLANIRICDIPPEILASIWPAPSKNPPKKRRIRDPLHSDATSRRPAAHRKALPPRPSPTVHRQQSPILRHLRKLLPSLLRRGIVPSVQRDELRDPLDIPATSSRHPNLPHLTQGTAEIENSPPTCIKPIRTGREPSRIADVPLAQGRPRNATACAPIKDDGCVRDEEFDSPPPSPNPDPQRASGPAPVNSGEHGSGRSCFCF
ncbi:WD40 repeat-like protein [Rhizopogon vinicolor AM-OR11-026]|uniref:WD40 repeat-like protein n=1 Tax=Rhizopogon vinicolor AM-OR11-026 TaxID=1314800 RepID=A0A1B7MLN2_9AGAM|nr:WD40 repeat-like protein [Rhizopogon vinicolor AM-OR11-026]